MSEVTSMNESTLTGKEKEVFVYLLEQLSREQRGTVLSLMEQFGAKGPSVSDHQAGQ